MEQQTAVGLQPLAEFFRIGGALAACGLTIGFEKEPGGASTRAQFVADGVVGAKPVIAAQSCNIMKTFHQIGRKGEQFFHLYFGFLFLIIRILPGRGITKAWAKVVKNKKNRSVLRSKFAILSKKSGE